MQRDLAPDHAADRLAASQCGVISRRQARAAKLTSKQIRTRVASGRWRQVLPGVYAVAGAPTSWEQDAMVAVLAG
ncbi:MAG: type IV toxin-antitoxin system AbiEi family antitoxin domain-containing protein, partial [Acidimicrobiia bacterium]